jgi:hypothetical protein
MVLLKAFSPALLLLLSSLVTAQKGGAGKGFPETGDGNGAAGGIFALLPGAKRPSKHSTTDYYYFIVKQD